MTFEHRVRRRRIDTVMDPAAFGSGDGEPRHESSHRVRASGELRQTGGDRKSVV
jgi:hypothetical protein